MPKFILPPNVENPREYIVNHIGPLAVYLNEDGIYDLSDNLRKTESPYHIKFYVYHDGIDVKVIAE